MMEQLSPIENNDHVLQQLNCKRLPVLSSNVSSLLVSLTDDDIEFNKLAKILENYPSIAMRLIALSNSAWSQSATEINTLEAACTRLGLGVIRSISIALSVASPFNTNRCPAFDSKYYWATSLLAAEAASWLSPYCNNADITPASARAAGLMHNLGLLLLADKLPTAVNDAILLVNNDEQTDISEALQQTLGFNYGDAGRVLGENWKLPAIFLDALSCNASIPQTHPTESKTAELIQLTTSMVSSLQRNRPWSLPSKQQKSLGITSADATKIYERLSKQLTKIQEMAETLFS